MRTETYNLLRENSVDSIAWNNACLSIWASDPVGVGSTLTAPYANSVNETGEFIRECVENIRIHTDIIAKLDELHGV